MIVPGAKGGMPVPGSAEQPSEANLLMALAEMHKQGRFQVAGGVVPMPGAATPADRAEALKIDELNKLTTNRTLSKALGGGAKIIPMSPSSE